MERAAKIRPVYRRFVRCLDYPSKGVTTKGYPYGAKGLAFAGRCPWALDLMWMILQQWGSLQRDIGMLSGKVKWFNNAKGYGFILADGRDEDLFAHYSAIQMDGYKTLKAGQAVSFDIIQGPKGLHAVNISAAQSTQDKSAPATSTARAAAVGA